MIASVTYRTGIPMSVLVDEDPDMLSTLLSVIEFTDAENKRRR